MRKFKIGDWVKITNPQDEHSVWRGRTGLIIREAYPKGDQQLWVVSLDSDADNTNESWWLSSSLEYLGTEETKALLALGDSYFA